ncbi:hypothetical protein V8E36_009629 [Tilletia maclaganii]
MGPGFPRPRSPPWRQVSRISLNINGAPGLVAASGRAFGGRAHADIVATLLHDVDLIANLHAEHQRRTTAPLTAPSSPRPAHRAHPLAAYTVILPFTHSCHFGGRVRARYVAHARDDTPNSSRSTNGSQVVKRQRHPHQVLRDRPYTPRPALPDSPLAHQSSSSDSHPTSFPWTHLQPASTSSSVLNAGRILYRTNDAALITLFRRCAHGIHLARINFLRPPSAWRTPARGLIRTGSILAQRPLSRLQRFVYIPRVFALWVHTAILILTRTRPA